MASSSGPPERSDGRATGEPKRRRLVRWLAGVALAIVLVLAGLVYWRLPIAGAVLRAGLDRMGFPGAALSVDALSLSHLRLSGVRLGREADVAAADVTFDLTRLPGQPVTRLSLDHVQLDLTNPDGPLRRRLEARRGQTGGGVTLRQLPDLIAALPAVAIRDAALTVAVDGRPVTVSGEVDAVRHGGGYTGRVALRLSGALRGKSRTLSVNGTLRLDPAASVIDATLGTGDRAVAGAMTLRAALTPAEARIGGDLHIDVTDPDGLSAMVPALAGAGGTLRLAMRTPTPVAIPPDVRLDPDGLTDVLWRAAAGGIAVEASVRDGQYQAGLSDLNGTLSAVATVPDRHDGLPHVVGQVSLRAGLVEAGGVTVSDATLEGPFRLDRQDDAVTLVLPQPLRLGAAQAVTADGTVVVEPLAATLGGGRAYALRLAGAPASFRADLGLKLALGAARLWSGAGAGHRFDIAPLVLRLAGTRDTDGTVNLSVRVPDLAIAEARRRVALDDLVLSLRNAGNSLSGSVRGRLSTEADGKPFVAPVRIESDLALWRRVLTYEVRAEALNAVHAVAKGRQDFIAGRGMVDITVSPFNFAPGAVALRTLAPGLSGTDIRAGRVGASAHLAWGQGAPTGTAALRIDGMDLAAGGATVEGLSADIRLDRLDPPRTPAGQILRVRRITAGASVDDLALRFSLVDGASANVPAVKIESLTGRFAGGRLTIPPAVIDSGAAANRVRIEIADVDLARLFGLFGLEGVSGTGRLSGAIPVIQKGGAVGIAGGRLAAAGPGVLRIRSEAAKTALQQGGAEVALMLSALEDFHYESLTLEIEKALDGEGRLILHTRGKNPAVRNGQPFIINLNVSGNVDRLAAVIVQALRLPGALVRSMVPGTP